MFRITLIQIVLVSLLCGSHENIPNTTFSEMESNMAFADALADAVNPASFPVFAADAVTTGISFVTSIISFADTILKLVGPSESQELEELKRLYTEMTTRFDSVDLKLRDLERQMKWSHFTSQFGKIEQAINANYVKLQNIFLQPLSMKESEKNNFIDHFKATCMNCAMKFYRGMMGHDRLLIGDILRKAEPILEFNRPEMQVLMTGLFQLLIKGISTELFYDRLVHGDAYYKMNKNEWSDKIHYLTSRMTLVDTEVENQWYNQAGKDIDNLSIQYVSQSNQKFSETLYKFLKDKYYWRDWLVIVYKPITMAKNHNNFVCDGYKKYRLHGRNIVVSSVNNTTPPLNTTWLLENIQNTGTIYAGYYICGYSYFTGPYYCPYKARLNAANLYTGLSKNCSMYASVGVIDSWVDLWYQGSPERLVHKRTSGRNSYSIHYFG